MKILYICTHNRCRSILAEAITNELAAGRVEARSAGSQALGEVHPLSLKFLAEAAYSTEGLQSHSWDDFEDWNPDVVITVCDSAAGEACPVWFSNCVKVHWGLQDPSKIEGSEVQIKEAFEKTIAIIEERVSELLKLDMEGFSDEALKKHLEALAS